MDESETGVKFILEWQAINGFPTSARAGGVSSLSNKVLQYPVKDGSVIVTFQAQLDEISGGLQRQKPVKSSHLHPPWRSGR